MTPGSGRGRRSWGWPLGLALALAVSAAANIGFAIVASRDPSFAVEPDYYRKGLEWDRTMAQEDANRALGWGVSVDTEPAEQPGALRLAVRLRDRNGRAVDGATVTLEARHGARAGKVVNGSLVPVASGRYAADLPLSRGGLWELRLTARRGDAVFTRRLIAEVPSSR